MGVVCSDGHKGKTCGGQAGVHSRQVTVEAGLPGRVQLQLCVCPTSVLAYVCLAQNNQRVLAGQHQL